MANKVIKKEEKKAKAKVTASKTEEQKAKAEAKKSKKVKYGAKTMKCSCTRGDAAQYQDEQHTKGIRIFNICKLGDAYRCTVCGKVIDKGGTVIKQGNPERN